MEVVMWKNGGVKWKMEVGKWKSETRSGMAPIGHDPFLSPPPPLLRMCMKKMEKGLGTRLG